MQPDNLQPVIVNCSSGINSYLIIAGWLVVILGWLVTNHQNNQRESRKELRASLDNIIDEVHNIHTIAIEYYTNNPQETAKLGFEIKSGLGRLIKKSERLSGLYAGYFKTNCLEKFMDVVTGNDFEQQDRVVRNYTDDAGIFLSEISFQADSLIDEFEDDYCKIFNKNPHSFFNFIKFHKVKTQ